jgi:hypothetical protein
MTYEEKWKELKASLKQTIKNRPGYSDDAFGNGRESLCKEIIRFMDKQDELEDQPCNK